MEREKEIKRQAVLSYGKSLLRVQDHKIAAGLNNSGGTDRTPRVGIRGERPPITHNQDEDIEARLNEILKDQITDPRSSGEDLIDEEDFRLYILNENGQLSYYPQEISKDKAGGRIEGFRQ